MLSRQLEGRRVVVAGGTSGIGEATAGAFAARGPAGGGRADRPVGSAADVAEAIVLAATNPHITGAVLPVDGGYTLPRG
ncbi:MAG TPA: hypothetical protein VFG42_23520 [Baekduia sp.]|uniref:hypothetical protein n=1 Tax=Baekduia sp. TaxID=2600305 RepID=UPI002D7A3E54|nr:hypothetical protein [Baekduia sp.]HET6509783.1 hypothetical protein [Baekduia sp.]